MFTYPRMLHKKAKVIKTSSSAVMYGGVQKQERGLQSCLLQRLDEQTSKCSSGAAGQINREAGQPSSQQS